MDLAQHATNDSEVEPLRMNSEGSGTGGSTQQPASDLIRNGEQYNGTGGRAGNNYDSEGRAVKRGDWRAVRTAGWTHRPS
ncbi:MAG: hypothetical protein ACJ736_07775 [Streptomyces sp.]